MSYAGPTIRQMEYILAVAREGSFTGAARACGVSQPALSKQIQEVEELLGGAIFERARPRVLVTAMGEILVERAERVLDEAAMMLLAARDCGPGLCGELHIGVIPTIAPYLLPGLLGKLRVDHPDALLVLHEAYTDELLTRLGTGKIDLALLAMPIEESNLVGEDLYDEPFALLAPWGHELADGGEVSLGELRDASLLLMDEGHCFRDQALEVCAMAGAHERAQIRAASVSTLVRMVEAGVGATLVPMLALHAEVTSADAFTTRFFVEGEGRPMRRVGVRWRKSDPRGEGFGALAGTIRAHADALSRARIASTGGSPLAMLGAPESGPRNT